MNRPDPGTYRTTREMPVSRWTYATCGEVRHDWNNSLQGSPDRVVSNMFSALARQEEFPTFLRNEGQATRVVAVTMDAIVGRLQRIVLDLWGIPTDRQRIVYPGTLRALQVHDALGHYNITRDATLYVFPKARGGMNSSTAHQHWHILAARDPSTGPGFMQHLTPKRTNPLHAVGLPPGHQEGRGEAAPSDFVPLCWGPFLIFCSPRLALGIPENAGVT